MDPNRKSSLLIIYTGGTIGMKEDPLDHTLKPFDFSQILTEVPELGKFALKIDSIAFDPLIDSSDVDPGMWKELARIIHDKYDNYDGFIILHGTDTMAYSASALSFMMDGLNKPVVFTGSQLPIGVARTDGKENLISAAEIASAVDREGHPRVPEVCIYFDSLLMRGNRAVKVNSDEFRAFSSPNLPPLAIAGIDIRYNDEIIRKPLDWYGTPSVNTTLDTRVSILKLHPGITSELVGHVLLSPGSRAVILETYGAGNAPSATWFLDLVREAVAQDKILLNVTQCLSGRVNMGIYATGRSLERAGVINGYDITTEGALGKLFHLLGRSGDQDWVKSMLRRNLKGEITVLKDPS